MRAVFALQFLVLFGSLLMSGCGAAGGDEDKILKSAKTALPIAVEMEELYGPADHFITHFGWRSQKSNTWTTEVFFGGRYNLTMQVEVEIDYGNNRFKLLGEPTLYLVEVTKITKLSGGRTENRFGKNFTFTQEEWKTLYKNDGDFSTIGIKLNPTALPAFDDYINGWRKDRVPISLLNDN